MGNHEIFRPDLFRSQSPLPPTHPRFLASYHLQIAELGKDDEKLQVRIVRLRTFSALPKAVTSQTVVIIKFSFCGSKLVGMEGVNFIHELGTLAGGVARKDTQLGPARGNHSAG